MPFKYRVALFARAWIEITAYASLVGSAMVALFARAWIEMLQTTKSGKGQICRPLHEGVD